MVKNKQSNLIASVKNAKHRGHQQIYYKLIYRGGGGCSVLVNYESFLSNLFSLAPQLFFSINCIRNRLLRVSFIDNLLAPKQEN